MWPKSYRDYKADDPLVKEQVRPGKGIIGCEMHDLNSWGDDASPRKPRSGLFSALKKWLFGKRGKV